MTNTRRKHAKTGWTRELVSPTSDRWLVIPRGAVNLPEYHREVVFMGAGGWANLEGDDVSRMGEDRIVQVSGPELAPWAVKWLETANAKSKQAGRDALEGLLCDEGF